MDDKELRYLLDEASDRGATEDQLRELHKRLTQEKPEEPPKMQPDIAGDILKSGGTGLAKGTVSLATLPFDLGSAAGGYLAKKAVGGSDLGITPESTLGKGLEFVFGKGGVNEQFPSSATEGLQNLLGLTYKPKTTAGQFAETIGSYAPAFAAFPTQATSQAGSLAAKAANILKEATFTGGGSELAGQMTKGSEYEPLARIAGGIGGYVGGNNIMQGTKNLAKGAFASSPEAIDAAKSKLFDIGAKTSEEMTKIGAIPTQAASTDIFNKVISSVSSTGSKIDDVLTPQTKRLLELMEQDAQAGNLTISAIDKYATMFNNVKSNDFDKLAAGAAKRALISSINDIKPQDLSYGGINAVSLLNRKKAEFSKAFRFEEIGDLLEKAGGDNNKIKANLTKFLRDNDYERGLAKRGWQKNEINAVKNASKTGITEGLINLVGKFGVDLSNPAKNVFMPLAGAGLASAFVGPAVAPELVAAGTLAKQAGKYLARGKAQNVLDTIRTNPIRIKP